jgi:predicted esterase
MLVVLHGDRQSAASAAQRWRAATKERGWVLLSIQCPVDEGCKDSWWQWNGDPSFIAKQIDKVAASVKIDRTRIALAGWSGGASYMGANANALHYVGLVFHGGGMTGADGCASKQRAYFLVGDRNPLHRLAIDLRAYFDRCKAEVVWDVIKGGDHDREDRALDRTKALAILDWLSSDPAKPSR